MPQMEYEQAPAAEVQLRLGDELPAEEALTIVTSTFDTYQADRQGHERRWEVHDRLFLGVVDRSFWPNSTVERSNLPFLFVFDQVESALSILTASIFYGPEPWFEVEPSGDTPVEVAREVEAGLRYIFDAPTSSSDWRDSRAEIVLAFTSALLYGNGFLLLEWDPKEKVPRPRWVDHRDVYIDPACQTPAIDDCRAVIVRMFKTVRQLEEMRDIEGMDLPPTDLLWEMARARQTATADRSIQQIEMFRKSTSGLRDIYTTASPAEDAVEVLVYYSKSRIIWVLARMWVAYNQPNTLGFIPIVSMPCYPVPRRFYAQSIADIQEPVQRGIETLMNRHLDEINLRLNPPRVVNWAMQLAGSSPMRWYPGQTIQGDPNSIRLLFEAPPTPVFPEIQWLVQVGERMTGVNSLASGVPIASNMARTLGGIRSLAAASNTRLARIAFHAESYMLAPLLLKAQKMLATYRPPTELVPAIKHGAPAFVEASAFSRDVRYVLRVASQMVGRERLLQIFPMLFQTLVSAPMMGELGKLGLTVNFPELVRMLQEATGIGRRYQILRTLTEEELARMQNPPIPPEVQADLIKEQIRAQARIAAVREKKRLTPEPEPPTMELGQ